MAALPRTVWQPGSVCKNGKLYRFDRRQVVVMAPWPDPRAWYRTATKAWQPTRRRADEVLCQGLWDLNASPADIYLEVARNFLPMTRPGETGAVGPQLAARLQALAPDLAALGSGAFPWPDDLDAAARPWARILVRQYVAFSQYFAPVPVVVRQTLSALRERRWQLLNLFARVPGGLELYHANRGLTFCLANNWAFHTPAVTHPYRSARALVARKQRHIAGWLGFPATPAVVRLLAKFEPAALSMRSLLFLRHTVADPAVSKVLGHLPRLNADVAEIVTSNWLRPLATPALLLAASTDPVANASDNYAYLLNEVVRLYEQVHGSPCPWRFTHRAQLEGRHEELTALALAMRPPEQVVRWDDADYPSPPLPGTADIIPLISAAELSHEGQIMQHCVGTYIGSVIAGHKYFYHVRNPVVATLGIRRVQANRWAPFQIRGPGNATIDARVARRIQNVLLASGALA